jgi:hypothetical protein
MALQDDTIENRFPNIVKEGSSFGTASSPEDYVTVKQDVVARAAARKRQVLAPDRVAENEQDFLYLNPNANPIQVADYRVNKSRQDQSDLQQAAYEKDQARNRDRTVGEIAGDTATSLGIAGINTAAGLYGVANTVLTDQATTGITDEGQPVTTQISPDSVLGLSPKFAAATKALGNFGYSDPQKFSNEQVEKAQSFYKDGSDAREAIALAEYGDDPSLIEQALIGLSEQTGAASNTLSAYIDNPLAALDDVLATGPELLISGGLGSLARKGLVKDMDASEATRYLASAAGKKAAVAASGKIGVAYSGLSEGSNNAVQAKGEVLKTDFETLEKSSPYYNELVASGMSEDAARMRVSDQVFNTTFGISALSAALISKGTGAGKAEATLGTGGAIKGVAKGIATQAIEEPLQGLTGQLATNVAKKTFADTNQELTEDLGNVVATSFVVGTAAGAAVPAGVGSYQLASGAGKAIKNVATNTISNVKDARKVDAIIESGQVDKATDVSSETYSPSEAASVLLDPKFIPKDESDKNEHIAKIDSHVGNLMKEIESLMGKENQTPEDTSLISRKVDEAIALQEQRDVVASASLTDLSSDIEAISTATEQTEGTDKAVGRIFGSMQLDEDSISLEQQEAIVNSPALSTDQRGVVSSSIEVAKAKKLLSEVSTDIFSGGKGFLGINDHLRIIRSALTLLDSASAAKQLSNLKGFADRHLVKATDLALALADPTTADAIAFKYGLDYINKSSGKLVDVTKVEADALQSAVNQAQSLINVGASKPAPKQPSVETSETVSEEVTPPTKDTTKTEPTPIKEEVVSETKKKTTSEPSVKEESVFSSDAIGKAFSDLTKAESNELETSYPTIYKLLSSKKSLAKATEGNLGKIASALSKVKSKTAEATKAVYSKATALVTGRVNNNEAASIFKVKKPKDSENKLDTVEDFFSAVAKDSSVAGDLNEKQLTALPRLTAFHKEFAKVFNTEILKPKDIRYLKSDYAQMFLDENGAFDPNVVSTIAMAAYNWLGTQATGTLYNDEAAINSILNREDDHEVTPSEVALFSRVGDVRTTLAETLGNEIAANLGIKAKSDSSGEIEPNLGMSFGLYAIAAMDKMGLVEHKEVKASDFNDVTKTSNARSTTYFIRVATNVNNNGIADVEVPTRKVAGIGDVMRTSDGLLNKLFGLSDKMVVPTFEPVTTGPKQIVRSNQKVTKKVSSIIAKHNANPYTVKTNVVDVFDSLNFDVQQAIVGIKNPSTVHIEQRLGVEGKNAALNKDMSNFTNFAFDLSSKEEGMQSTFFFQHEVWKNNRVGLVGTLVNPQASKVHRHFVGNSQHVNTIDPTKPGDLIQFKLAVAASMGIGIDKLTVEESLVKYKELTDNPVLRNGVTAIQALNKDGVSSDENQAKILAAVKLGGEDTFSLDGLVALSEASSTKPFETNLFMEVDGITNGVIIGLIQLYGASDKASLQKMISKGGIFSDGVTTSFGDWKKDPTNLDSYEEMAKLWKAELNNSLTNSAIIDSIEALIGEIDRKKAKGPLMTTIYGSSSKKVIQLFSKDAMDSVYSDIAKYNNNQAKLDQIAYHLNVVAGMRGDNKISLTAGTAIDTILGNHIKNNVSTSIANTYGVALKETIKQSFGAFIDKRSEINAAMDMVFKIFKGSYDSIVKERTLLKGKPLSSDEKSSIVESLIDTAPIVHNYFSKETGDLTEGTSFLKTNKTRQSGIAYKTEQVYGTKLTNGAKSSTGFSSVNDFEAPGVAPAIIQIHSLDAAGMVRMMEEHAVLNVHDAIGTGINQAVNYSKDFNEIFSDLMENFSMREETQVTLLRSVEFMRKKFPNLEATISGSLKDDETVESFVNGFKATTKIDSDARKELMAETTYWTQYNIEDGGYNKANDTSITTATKEGIDEIKGSRIGVNLKSFNANYTVGMNADNTLQMFDDLSVEGNVGETAGHSAHLRSVISSTVNEVISPFNLHVKSTLEAENYGMTDGSDIYLATSTSAVANGIQMSAQEVYVHELIHVVTAAAIDANSLAAKELKRLFLQAERVITPSDFMNNPSLIKTDPSYATELEAATARYDYIFNNTNNSKTTTIDPTTGLTTETVRNNYLHEFLAIGLTNKQLRKALAYKDVSKVVLDVDAPVGILGKMIALYNKVITALFSKLTGTAGLAADKKMQVLGRQLAGIQHRQEGVLGKFMNGMEFTNAKINKVVGAVIKPLVDLAKSDLGQNSKNKVVRVASGIASLASTTEYEEFAKVMRSVRRNTSILRKGFIASIVTEAKGRTTNNAILHDLARYKNKVIDQARLHTAASVSSHVLSKYQDVLTAEEKAGITKVILRTDLVSLTSSYTTQELADFIGSPDKVKAEITALETKLSVYGKSRHYYRKQARNLGLIMATETSLEAVPMRNAYNIANLFHTGVTPTGDLKAAETLIDTLASLYAISYTSKADKVAVKNVIDKELKADPINNGFTFTLQVHNETINDSKARLFKGQDALFVKGYVKEVFNPMVTYKVAPASEEVALSKEGYKMQKSALTKDINDPNQEQQFMFVSVDGLQGSYDAGIASLTSRQAKGSDLIKVRAQNGDPAPLYSASADGAVVYSTKEKQARSMFGATDTRSPGTYLFPIMNSYGDTTGYRYIMNQANKDSILQQNNSFEALLGGMVANVQDKIDTVTVNNRLVSALREVYLRDHKDDPKNFVRISPKSTDKRLQEAYAMLPKEMRDEVKRVWGTDGMFVRHEDVDLAFGYRRMSVSGYEISDDETAKGIRKVVNQMNDSIGFLLNNRFVKVSENVWKETVSLVKDTIVVKSGAVLLGNITSNVVLLKVLGVPLKDIAVDHGIAFKGAIQYKKDSFELDKKQRELRLESHTPAAKKALEVSISRLQNDIASNPVTYLINAGVFQSIVEDVEDLDNPYSYKSNLGKFVAPVTDRTPKLIKDIASNLFLTHDTAAYGLLRDITQVSDFAARYALHQYNTKKRKTPMSEAESVNMIVETFINYDLPTHKSLQYANEMGAIMFTKFFIRTQKIIAYIIKNHPENVIKLLAIESVLGDVSDIIGDANILTNDITDKINVNPLGLLSEIIEPVTLKIIEDAI